jgi:hypothetical protein
MRGQGTLNVVSRGSESYAIDYQSLLILTSIPLRYSLFRALETVVMRPADEAVFPWISRLNRLNGSVSRDRM